MNKEAKLSSKKVVNNEPELTDTAFDYALKLVKNEEKDERNSED